MNGNRNSILLWYAFAAAAAYFLGQSVSWPLVGATSLKPLNMPSAADPGRTAAWFAVSTVLIATAVMPIAARIHGR